MELQKIIDLFIVNSKLKKSEQILDGHINITYLVTLTNGEKYILQKMNKYVFKNPPLLMENIINVTKYMKQLYTDNNLDYSKYVLDFIQTKEQKYYAIYNNEYFRMYHYIDNSCTYYNSSNLDILYQTGLAFGNFQLTLANFKASVLHDVIPNFHNTIDRFKLLKEAIYNDKLKRANNIKDIISEYIKLEPQAVQMTHMLNEGLLPLRVTHNDTKCNNVLIENNTNKALAVIDLDTIMPGLIGFDFGDAVRSGCSNAKEDETDLTKIWCDLDKFKVFAKGFLEKTKNVLTKNEIKTLSVGAFNMTIECGARFLTDYLSGDKYFHINYENHNLDRAINQLILAKDILNKINKMNEIIDELTK